jgi:hypothetical protein
MIHNRAILLVTIISILLIISNCTSEEAPDPAQRVDINAPPELTREDEVGWYEWAPPGMHHADRVGLPTIIYL